MAEQKEMILLVTITSNKDGTFGAKMKGKEITKEGRGKNSLHSPP